MSEAYQKHHDQVVTELKARFHDDPLEFVKAYNSHFPPVGVSAQRRVELLKLGGFTSEQCGAETLRNHGYSVETIEKLTDLKLPPDPRTVDAFATAVAERIGKATPAQPNDEVMFAISNSPPTPVPPVANQFPMDLVYIHDDGQRYDFTSSLLYQLWKAIRESQFSVVLWVNAADVVEEWNGTDVMDSAANYKKGGQNLKDFWRRKGRSDIADAIDLKKERFSYTPK